MFAGNSILYNFSLKKRYLYVVFVILFLILFAFTAEYILKHNINLNWKEIAAEKDKFFEEAVKSKFVEYQKDLIKNFELIQKSIKELSKTQAVTQKDLFDILNNIEDENLSVNLYDPDGKLVAWKNPIMLFDSHDFINSNYFFISHTNIYKLLNYASPLIIDDTASFYLVLSSLLDYNFPIGDRFISVDLNQKIFTRELKRNISFIDKSININSAKEKYIEIQSLGTDNSQLGYIQYYPLMQDDLIYELESYFKIIKVFLLLALGIILFIMLYELIKNNLVSPVRELVIVAILWMFRYFMLLIGFPSDFVDVSIFNPFYFASDFGYGIAKSAGELMITSIVLFISVINLNDIIRHFIKNEFLKVESSIFKIIIVLFTLLIILFLMRGYVATIISAVKDSNLNYLQQTEIIPSLEKIVMFINLLLATFSFIILILQLLNFSYHVLGYRGNQILGYIKLCIISLFVFLAYEIHPNPLVNLYERFSIIIGFILLSYFVKDTERILANTKIFIIVMLSSTVLLSIILISKVDKDREQKLIDLAKQISQPFDDWMAFIVDEALNEMVNSNLLQDKKLEVKDLAFNLWARSILSQKDYDFKLTIIDTNLQVISKFGIGSLVNDDIKLETLPDKKTVKVQETSFPKGGLKYYSGYTPLYGNSGKLTGAILLDVASSRSNLFEPDYTNILVAEKYEKDYFFSKTFYNEFKDGYVKYSTNPEFPKTLKIQEEVLKNIYNNNQDYYISSDIINNKPYKTVYIKPENNDLVIGVSVEIPEWNKFEILRLFIYLIFISGVFYFLILFKELKNIYQLSFFTKLLITFIIVSIVPLLIFSYYSNHYTQERMLSIVRGIMEDETEVVVKYLESYEFISAQEKNLKINDDFCQEVSKKTGVDFIFYKNATYTGSSFPELLQAELINRVLSEGAYMNIVLEGRRFFYETQNIGPLNYYAGYRPLIDNEENIAGIVAVLTLSKMSWIEEEIAERNIYMFAVYFIVLLLVFGSGILLSRQISLPLRRLSNYTRIIADGNLEIKIGSKRQDEIGRLESAFDKMTADLKQKRDELVKIEKEIAWREMAKQVAHEIKNPLTPIKLSIQQLYKAYKDGAKNFDEIFRQAYEMISEQIEALNRIASEFSNFARMPVRKLEVCSVKDLIDEAIQLFAQYQGISFIKNYAGQDLKVIADRDELRRAFVNIIRNSVQAIGNIGTIEVVIQKQDEHIIISIADNGPGIPDEVAKRIFEPNFSTKSDGMGLGLAIVKKTVEDLNGEISFTTKVGEGTKFMIKLKVVKDD